MYRRRARRSFFAVAALAALTTLGWLSACADPTTTTPSGGGGSPAAGESPGATSGSYVTTTWDLQPVDSVAKLVPDEYRSKPIQNGQYNDYPPQEFLEGQTLVGIQPDIVLALSEVMGVKIENVSVGSFDSLIPGLSTGRYDMSSADFGVTKPRLEQVDFVSEFAIGTAFATKTGSPIKVEKTTDLCGHSIGLIAGSYYIDQVNEANSECQKAGMEPITVQTYPTDGARVLAVTNGRVEITATTQDAMAWVIKSESVPLTLQPLIYEPLEQGIALKNDSTLGPALQAAMKEIMANGTYTKILEKWDVAQIGYTSPNQVKLYTEPSQLK
jgi:polar amino acid transport system substrate-binding protein